MQVDALAVRLRPRPMAEAADLGLLLVHEHAGSLLRTWVPVHAALVLLALASFELAPWLPALLVFAAKPWLDRTILFVLARGVFGEATRWSDLWAQRSQVWAGELWHTWTLRRLSPWRAYTQPIAQLEGQRGAARRKRRDQLLRGKRGAALAMHLVFAHVELVFVAGAVALALWFAPEGTRGEVWTWFSGESASSELALAALYAGVVLVVEPFYVAAGFAMYLNRRVELEAWDVEQEFRRALA